MKAVKIIIYAVVLVFAFCVPRIANALSFDNGKFRASFDFSSQPSPPVDFSVRFIDVMQIPVPDPGLEVWTVSLYDDPSTTIYCCLSQNTFTANGPFTIGFNFSLNSPCCSGLPQEVADKRGFFEMTVTGGKLEFASAIAIYRYHNQPSVPEINQEIFFHLFNSVIEPVPEPGTWVLLTTGLLGLAGYAYRRKHTA